MQNYNNAPPSVPHTQQELGTTPNAGQSGEFYRLQAGFH